MEDHRNQQFTEADFTGARFTGIYFHQVTMTDALVDDVVISGHIGRLTVNGVEVGAYVDAELDRRHPERVLLRATDPDGLRQAWDAVEAFAAATVDRARQLPPEALDERVDGEWSYLQTLRHLTMATDRWITGPVLGEDDWFHPLGWPNDPHDEVPPGIFLLDATPTFDEVLEARRGRMDRMAGLLSAIGDHELAREVENPNGGTTTVLHCIHVVLREEWWHDQYARRDLSVLEGRAW